MCLTVRLPVLIVVAGRSAVYQTWGGSPGNVADTVDESGGDCERDDTPCTGENLGFLALSGAFPDGQRPDFKCSDTELSVEVGWVNNTSHCDTEKAALG